MSKSIKCDRCGAENAMTNLVMAQYQEVRIAGMSWDVCKGCKETVIETITKLGTSTALKDIAAIRRVLKTAGVWVEGTQFDAGVLIAGLILDRDRLAEKVAALEAAVTAGQHSDAN